MFFGLNIPHLHLLLNHVPTVGTVVGRAARDDQKSHRERPQPVIGGAPRQTSRRADGAL